jgi:hypothetical protein
MGEGGASVEGDSDNVGSSTGGGAKLFSSRSSAPAGGCGESGRTGRNDLRLNESNGSCVELDGKFRSNFGASLILVGLEPQLNILTVLDVRISGVLGTGRVWELIAGGLLNIGGSPREIGGSRGGLSWAWAAGRECEEALLPKAVKTELRLGRTSVSVDREEAIEPRGVATSIENKSEHMFDSAITTLWSKLALAGEGLLSLKSGHSKADS